MSLSGGWGQKLSTPTEPAAAWGEGSRACIGTSTLGVSSGTGRRRSTFSPGGLNLLRVPSALITLDGVRGHTLTSCPHWKMWPSQWPPVIAGLMHALRQYTERPSSIHVVVQVLSHSPRCLLYANSSCSPTASSLSLLIKDDFTDGGFWLLGRTQAQNCCISRCSSQMYSLHSLHGSPHPLALT